MNLYKISQNKNNGYETYDSAVVVANSPQDAAKIHPGGYTNDDYGCSWVDPSDVKVEYLGKSSSLLEAGTVVCSSFNAG